MAAARKMPAVFAVSRHRPEDTSSFVIVALFESKYRMERLISDNPDWKLARFVAGL